jgi:chromosome segregation ATPase
MRGSAPSRRHRSPPPAGDGSPRRAERDIDALVDTLRATQSHATAWKGAELRDEARKLGAEARRRSPRRDLLRREEEYQATRRERAARDALAQSAAEEELQTERIRRHAAEKRADSLAKELAEVRAQLVVEKNRSQGIIPVPVAALAAEARGVAQMGEEIASLQEAIASTQSECAAAMAAMTAECSLVYALVDEIRQRNDDATVSVALMTKAMTVYAGLEKTAATARHVTAKDLSLVEQYGPIR